MASTLRILLWNYCVVIELAGLTGWLASLVEEGASDSEEDNNNGTSDSGEMEDEDSDEDFNENSDANSDEDIIT
ncbi:hypothetical protein CVT25_009900 [Psilocybe cyanescens]|uniref:Uncharacterized protein n=1 Tax=Psilocybe cyanescens TaxID=93625 RepID=A0A409XT94_PSICY|nr:hypothetical protein CVT25_009900 [Psilocybe cyanescens]